MTPAATASPALPLVYVVGDSISIHYGPFLERALEGTFHYDRKGGAAEALRNLDVATGANGGDSSMVLAFLKPLLADDSFRPALLLLNCGLHDIKQKSGEERLQVPLEEYRENLRAILRAVRECGVPAAWVRTTHSADSIHNSRSSDFHRFASDNEAYDAAALAIMGEAGVPVVDLRGFTRTLGADEALFCDHVHFPPEIREKQAAFIAGWLFAWKALAA